MAELFMVYVICASCIISDFLFPQVRTGIQNVTGTQDG